MRWLCTDQGRQHLGRVHDGMTTRLLLTELVHHDGGLGQRHLVLVTQQLDQLRAGAGSEISIVLVVYQVDHSVLQHPAGLGQPLHRGGLGRVQLGGGNL